ncbi:uncharacterized protein LOC111383693 [Olea europaea subsp. europaea]|uniref:Uncharacterized protein LOC111383693 n=1 Tax=Olea europaea subsp. europaea TaxID=158383 RepID=A0A8S0V6T5_OLEEU|nr:uncharacterized protein LOC111383693 [Olea europaea subsp. europaea]
MEEEKEGDFRVPLVSSLFCLCLTSGGIFLVLYVFFPNLSKPWYPIAALALIGSPWLFWFLIYIYTCMKVCCCGNRVDNGQISRRFPGSSQHGNDSTANSSRNGDYGTGGKSLQGGRESSVTSSKECEMPLTYSV